MPTLTETYINDLKINKPTRTQLKNATELSNDQLYFEDPEFNGNKVLSTDTNGDIAETDVTNTELGYLSGATSSIQTQLNNKASTSLDNLSATGQMIIDSQNGTISNCILDIPQDIKLELNNGTLTLKSGSVITYPDGTQVQTTVDKPRTQSTNDTFLLTLTSNGSTFEMTRLSRVCSGSTDSLSGTAFHLWYDTANNIIKRYGSDGTTIEGSGYSMPIAVITASNGAISSIDQVFNGAGYIGSSIFVLPGVKYLAPNGKNTDGTLKSYANTYNDLKILTPMAGLGTIERNLIGYNNQITVAQTQYSETPANARITFDTKNNISYSSFQVATLIDFGKVLITDGKITQFDIRQPVRTATTEMLDKVQDQVDTKQDIIQDLDTIRSGSTLGATAVQPSELDTVLDTKIDKGYAVNDFATNCLTEIPQDIKLELNNGTLTLKSGSVVTKPDGTQYQTTSDTSTTISSNGTYFIFPRTPNVAISSYSSPNRVGSGSTLPADASAYAIFFNTTDNIIYNWNWNENKWVSIGLGFPIAIVTVSNGAITSIDQVFNGAGYIGHHAFVLPGVKALIPNGFNDDGSLKNTLYTTSSLRIDEMAVGPSDIGTSRVVATVSRWDGYVEVDKYTDADFTKAWIRYYVKENNKIYTYNASYVMTVNEIPIAYYIYNDTIVTQFDIRPVSGLSNNYISNSLTGVSGYDATKTQTLKHVNGVLTWVTDS